MHEDQPHRCLPQVGAINVSQDGTLHHWWGVADGFLEGVLSYPSFHGFSRCCFHALSFLWLLRVCGNSLDLCVVYQYRTAEDITLKASSLGVQVPRCVGGMAAPAEAATWQNN